MSNLLTVFNFEFKQYLKKKSTIVMFVIYFIIAFGITFVPTLFSGDNVVSNLFKGEDNSNFQRSAYIIKENTISVDKALLKEAKEYSDRAVLEKDIEEDKIDEGIIITKDSYEYLTKSNSLYSNTTEFNQIFDLTMKQNYYAQNGVDYLKVQGLEQNAPKAKVVKLGSAGDTEQILVKSSIVYFLAFIIYIMVFMFGTVLANNVAREKTNRAMELLVVTVKPATLILGKVLAFTAIAITQVLLLIGAFFMGAKINFSNYSDSVKFIVDNLDYNLILMWFIFSLTGFIMLMFMFASFASLVSRIEEVNTVLTLPIMLFFVAFFLNIYTMNNAGNGKLVEILSFIPLTSYFSMVTRYAVAEVTFVEIVISYAFLVATTMLVAFVCVKVYRNATLRYGKKLNFFKLLASKE